MEGQGEGTDANAHPTIFEIALKRKQPFVLFSPAHMAAATTPPRAVHLAAHEV